MDMTNDDKRLFVAASALQGLLACPEFDIDAPGTAKISVRYADALLAELAKPEAPKEINNG